MGLSKGFLIVTLLLAFLSAGSGCSRLFYPIGLKEEKKAEEPEPQAQSEQQRRTGQEIAALRSEITKLRSEMEKLKEENAELRGRLGQQVPAEIKKFRTIISLKNGSIIFGEIVGEDGDELRVETEIGILPIRRDWIQTIVYSEKKPTLKKEEVEPTETEAKPEAEPKPEPPGHAKCVLVGQIEEEEEKVEGATIYLGQVKNVGNRRADFVQITFTVKDTFGRVIRSDSAFVAGSHYTFKSGISADTSLEPQAVGSFRCLVSIPARFVAAYSYSISWEEYE